jgi:hypothetical protein
MWPASIDPTSSPLQTDSRFPLLLTCVTVVTEEGARRRGLDECKCKDRGGARGGGGKGDDKVKMSSSAGRVNQCWYKGSMKCTQRGLSCTWDALVWLWLCSETSASEWVGGPSSRLSVQAGEQGVRCKCIAGGVVLKLKCKMQVRPNKRECEEDAELGKSRQGDATQWAHRVGGSWAAAAKGTTGCRRVRHMKGWWKGGERRGPPVRLMQGRRDLEFVVRVCASAAAQRQHSLG